MNSTHGDLEAGELLLQVRTQLLDVAEASIRRGLRFGRPPTIDPRAFGRELRQRRATFVTLRIGKNLRGCIGSIRAIRPLVADVAHNAFEAAFSDPRFPPLRAHEFPRLEIAVSVLSPMYPFDFVDEADLLEQLRPGTDGLELEYGPYRSVLLPDVWAQVQHPKAFLAHLKLKAGLSPSFWSNRLRLNRFTTEHFSRHVATDKET